MGGYDIFRSQKDSVTGKWLKPENLGYPVNTPDEDLYFCLSAKTNRAFMSSYRTGGFGEKDIYEIIPVKNVQLNGLVTEGGTDKPAENIVIHFIPAENAMKGATSAQVRTVADGSYHTALLSDNVYMVYISRANDTLLTDTLVVPLNERDGYVYVQHYVLPAVLVADSSVTFAGTIKAVVPVAVAEEVSETLYFATNRSDLEPAAKAKLQDVIAYLKKHKEASIHIAGHADGSGPDAINQSLSVKRAEAAAAYLKSKGIPAAQISTESFGSQKPTATNSTAAGRAKNRRVEIVVR